MGKNSRCHNTGGKPSPHRLTSQSQHCVVEEPSAQTQTPWLTNAQAAPLAGVFDLHCVQSIGAQDNLEFDGEGRHPQASQKDSEGVISRAIRFLAGCFDSYKLVIHTKL